MAKTKVEKGADTAKQIADAVEAAIGAWSPIVGNLVKGVRLLVKKAKERGDLTPEEEAQVDADIAESEGLIDQMSARGAEFRRLRDAEKAAGGE